MLVRLAWRIGTKLTNFLEQWHTQGWRGAWQYLKDRFDPPPRDLTAWFHAYRPTPKLLNKFRAHSWPESAPRYTILLPVCDPPVPWLQGTLASVQQQTYPHWHCVCVNDGDPNGEAAKLLDVTAAQDARFIVLHTGPRSGVANACQVGLTQATGHYFLVLDHDDALEPHALHRFAQCCLEHNNPDLLYSDEVITTGNLDEILAVRVRPGFSPRYFLNHPYFVHAIAIRLDRLQQVHGFDTTVRVSHDVDLLLRLLDVCQRIAHVPDLLYRWRTHTNSLGHALQTEVQEATVYALQAFHTRRDWQAHISPHPTQFNVYQVQYAPPDDAKVAIIIPTKNRADLLQRCLASVLRTVPAELADIVIVDHASDEPSSVEYLQQLRQRHRVVSTKGDFNFARLNNTAVADIRGPYTHYLFLNNDVFAGQTGWLESMLGEIAQPNVGTVGALLIYADNSIQHAGIGLGLLGGADHCYRGRPLSVNHFERFPAENCELLSPREVMAVTAACQLIHAELYHEIGGFDEAYAVGFNDVDLCLRVRALGYRAIVDSNAVLIHAESQSRGVTDRHPHDTERFFAQYADLLQQGDPYLSPLRDPSPRCDTLQPRLTCPETVPARVLPGCPLPQQGA